MGYILENGPVIAMLFFFVFFLGVVFWITRPGVKIQLQNHAFIPLREENQND